jgi:tetratricopeptide (TPR) repeat protein
VKPSNILIAEDGGIYLADFGLARIAAAGESTLSGEVLLGTPQYISPEQARGAENLDEATDQYSLGIVLYELVVGRVPYNADTPFSIVHDHIYSPLPLPREINPRVPPGVERVLLKALAKAPGDRYASVAAMVEAFLRQLPEEHAMAAMGKEDPLELNGEALEAASEGARAGFMNRAHPKGEPVGHESPAQKWTWMAVGLLLACIALLALVLLASKAPLGSLTGRETGSGAVGRLEALPGSQALREALRQVSQHPGDPELRLELASHLEEEGYPGHAAEQYTRAGQLLLRQSRFLEAGKASLSALQLTGGPAESDQEVLGLAEEALYRSAEKEGFAELFVDLVGQFPQWGLVPVLEARHISRSVEPERGAQALVEHLDEHPGDAFALAALAEIEATSGNLREAERALKRALEQPGIPDWLRDHLNALERELGKGQD